jgi:PKD repeat protein
MSAEPGRISAATDQDRQTRPNSQCISPIAGFIPSATTVRVNQVVTFNNTSTGSAPLTYLWHFHDGLTSILENPTHAYTVMGVYTVTLTASNACGMSAHAPVTITVQLDKIVQAEPVPEQSHNGPLPAAAGGPDPFGYTFRDSSEPGGPAFDWIDVTGGTPLDLTDDEEANITLPFPFTFYGVPSTTLRVGNNGGVLFWTTSNDVPVVNTDLISATDNMIVPFWDDLSAETGNVYYQITGTAPNRLFVVEWYNRPHYTSSGGVGSVTLEMILYESTNSIKFQYQDVVFGDSSFDYGASATVGIRQSGSNYLQYSYNQPVLSNTLSICFAYPASPGCTSGGSASYAFVNHPWDWIEGVATPGETLSATLKRGGSPTTSTTTTINSRGRFSFDFRDSNGHMNVLPGDEVILVGGGLSTTIQVVDIAGSINIAGDTVTGQASQGVFPAQGVADVGLPTDLSYITKEITFDPTGHFTASFGSQVDIGTDHLAKVDYEDPNGNRVVQVLFPEGLDIRALITEGRIEGVTTPGATVQVIVSDTHGYKGSATTTADQTGFYSTTLYNGNRKVRLQLGDHVSVSKPGRVREMDLTMYHVSYIRPWENRVVGTVYGISLPAQGAQIRIDLWSAAQNQWYTKYEGIKSDGSYNADFGGIVQMTAKDRIRVWATSPDGNQQAALGWALDIAASTTDDAVWGYTTANATVVISLYGRLENQTPVDLIGTATMMADTAGYFSTTVMAGGSVADIVPNNAVIVQPGEYSEALLVRPVDAQIDVSSDMLSLAGPPNTRVHVEGRRAGVQREDAPYQSPYVWREVTLDSDGKASVSLSPFDVHGGDWFDFTLYGPKEGVAVHHLMIVPSTIYLPIVLR